MIAFRIWWWQPFFCITILLIVFIIYKLRKAQDHPGRMMTAIRENENAAHAAGKDVTRRRIEAFVIGAMVMGLASYLSQHLRLITHQYVRPSKVTFLFGYVNCRWIGQQQRTILERSRLDYMVSMKYLLILTSHFWGNDMIWI